MSFDYKRLVKFEHNIGEKEAKMRLMAGAAALLISVFTASIILLVLGLVLTATGYTGWCPAYSGMNKNTCDAAESAKEEETTPPASE